MSGSNETDLSGLPGTCTALTPQKKNPQRLSVFADGHFICGADSRAVRKCGIETDSELTAAAVEQLQVLDRRYKLTDHCCLWLARRAHSKTELRRKALRKGYEEPLISEVLVYLEEQGWIDEATFALDFAEIQFRRKNRGPEKIKADLTEKGISRRHIRDALAAIEDEEQLRTAMQQIVRKNRNKLLRYPEGGKRKHKLVDLLRRKGYHPDVIFRYTDELIEELTDETTDI